LYFYSGLLHSDRQIHCVLIAVQSFGYPSTVFYFIFVIVAVFSLRRLSRSCRIQVSWINLMSFFEGNIE